MTKSRMVLIPRRRTSEISVSISATVPIGRIDGFEVGDVVAHVGLRGGVNGREPTLCQRRGRAGKSSEGRMPGMSPRPSLLESLYDEG
jgi:hypothetical protein